MSVAPVPPNSAWIDPTSWDGVPVPEQEWTVRDVIPARKVCLFSGHGGAGKSTIALHLCVAAVLARMWLLYDCTPGSAFFIDAEDEPAVIHRRLDCVLKHYNTKFTDLNNGLRIRSLVGESAVLAVPDKGIMKPTDLYLQILAEAREHSPKQIVIASNADVFGGNELARTEVTQFIGLLTKLAVAADGSVILIAHPSLAGINSQSGISGSTAWHNAVRAQMYLTSPGNGEDTTGLRKLEFKKNQYGPAAKALALQWQNGLFLPAPTLTDYEKAAADAKSDRVFEGLLRRFLISGRNVNDKPASASGYAPRAFAKEEEAITAGLAVKDFEASMRRLFQKGTIRNVAYGGKRQWERIEFAPPHEPPPDHP